MQTPDGAKECQRLDNGGRERVSVRGESGQEHATEIKGTETKNRTKPAVKKRRKKKKSHKIAL